MKRSAVNKKGGNVLPAVLGKGSSLKSLLLASLAGCIVIGAPSASAAELSDVDLSKKPLDTPTLDYLNQNNVTLPAGDDGTAAPVPPSAYTLTKVDAAGENTITKFEWDESTQSYNVVNYQIDLKQTEYGEGNQTHTVTLENGPLKDVTINVHYDEPDVSVDTSSQTYDNEYKEQTTSGSLRNPPSKKTEHAQIIGGAVKDADFSGSVLFENNKTSARLEITDRYGQPGSSLGGSLYRDGYYVDVIGGTIKNETALDKIDGTFLNNNLNTTINNTSDVNQVYVYIYGGALYNNADINNITADFIGNQVNTVFNGDGKYPLDNSYGGAIYNNANINSITANFIKNSVTGNYNSFGGAIYNNGTIGEINGNFVDNSVTSTSNSRSFGGAIYNANVIGDINANFSNNIADASGGGIYSSGTVGNITGNFVNNTAGVSGGGIYSSGTITNLTGDFVNNTAGVFGGGIYSSDTIGNITGDFINNTADSSGGGIYSYYGTLGNITGNFVNNTAGGSGGGIYSSSGTIEDITGDFVNNTADRSGGGIYSSGTVGNITGNFIENEAQSGNGGAIYIEGLSPVTGVITGDFISNYAGDGGGGIYNDGTIPYIKGNFIDNKANGSGGGFYNSRSGNLSYIAADFIVNSGGEFGGGLYNSGTITTIAGDFINNSLYSDEAYKNSDVNTRGGGLYNSGTVTTVIGDFVGNTVRSYGDGYDGGVSSGGAIANSGTMQNITGNFIENTVSSGGADFHAYGGAIYNNDSIGTISGSFIGNKADGYYNGYGGAINNYSSSIRDRYGEIIGYNSSNIDSIKGTFYRNSAYSDEHYAKGGAIYNHTASTIGSIEGDFYENSATTYWAKAYGGAIDNVNKIGTIKGNFVGNYTISGEEDASGGAVYNYSTAQIDEVNANFSKNYAQAGEYSVAEGGAVHNDAGILTKLTGNFSENYAESTDDKAKGGALYNYGLIEEVNGTFTKNYVHTQDSEANGGAIFNDGIYEMESELDLRGDEPATINKITGDFIGNEARSDSGKAYGGAIHNSKEGELGEIAGTFTQNKALAGDTARGGAVFNKSNIDTIKGDFVGNSAESQTGSAQGGAIYNEKNIDTIVNSSFVNNTAKSTSGSAKGGAIYSKGGETTISATDGYVSRFEGNTTDSAGKIEDNAIYLDTSTLNFEMKTGGKFLMKDSIQGKDYNVNITGDDIDNTRFYLHNDIDKANLTLANTTIDTINNQAHVYDLNSLTVNEDTKMVADVDLKNKEMDRFTAGSYGEHQGNINVVGMNLLSDAPENEDVTAVYFAQPGLKNNVTNGTGELPDSTQTTYYTPIYKYNVTYDKTHEYNGQGDGGYFLFAKGDRIFTPGGGTTGTGNPSDAFNPAVLTTPVANQAASQAAMTEAFKYVFEHADAFTQLPATERMSYIKRNVYALSTDYNDNLGGISNIDALAPEFNNKAGWVRPYVTFENMHLKNGPKVDAITYGTLVGFDTDFQDLKRGWYGMTTGYVGYNGSQLSYSGVDGSTNGGLLGVTQTFYKGNFWTALTASAGASVGEAQTMYGSDDFTTLLAGVASKTGYNFEFKEGKFIIQPIMYISYTFANTFDYTNAAGVKIENSPMHTLQLHPQVRFIMNTKNNWQPYISAGVVWNPFTSSKSTANGIVLPEMSMKPYAEYGVGVQKRWADKYTAFGQAMVRSGGRNGVALTFGFRWNIGKDASDKKNNEQVYKPERKVIKQARK